MSLVSGHPNIIKTHKCLASWRDLTNQAATDLRSAMSSGQVGGPLSHGGRDATEDGDEGAHVSFHFSCASRQAAS